MRVIRPRLRRAWNRVSAPLPSALTRAVQSRLLYEYSVYGHPRRLHLSTNTQVNDALFNTASGDIFVGEWVVFGHGVMILTGTHDISLFGRERLENFPQSGRDVHIDEGAWLASRVMVIGPCRIGAHAVVGAGSLVTSDVEPYTVVAGSPARFIKRIPHDES